jgi:hypothetical protein
MSQYARKRTIPLIGAVTGPVSLSLVAHGVLVVILILFTIERQREPKQLTDTSSADAGTVIALKGVRSLEPPKPEIKPETKPEIKESPKSEPRIEVQPQIKPTPPVVVPIPETKPETPAGFESTQKIDAARAAPPLPAAASSGSSALSTTPVDAIVAPGKTSAGVPRIAVGEGVASFTSVTGDRARSIVYVIDGSGSMTSCLPFIRQELQRSIMRLDAGQQFQVVVCRDYPSGVTGSEPAIFTFSPRADLESALVPATDLNKSLIRSWSERIEPLGRSRVLAGLERALELKPDLIFLLSRSVKRTGVNTGGVQEAILHRLGELNPADASGKRKSVIKALQFIEEDPTGLMQRIGKEHGDGPESYRVISVPEQR